MATFPHGQLSKTGVPLVIVADGNDIPGFPVSPATADRFTTIRKVTSICGFGPFVGFTMFRLCPSVDPIVHVWLPQVRSVSSARDGPGAPAYVLQPISNTKMLGNVRPVTSTSSCFPTMTRGDMARPSLKGDERGAILPKNCCIMHTRSSHNSQVWVHTVKTLLPLRLDRQTDRYQPN